MRDLNALRSAKLLTYLQIPFCPLTVYGITVPTTCHKNASVLWLFPISPSVGGRKIWGFEFVFGDMSKVVQAQKRTYTSHFPLLLRFHGTPNNLRRFRSLSTSHSQQNRELQRFHSCRGKIRISGGPSIRRRKIFKSGRPTNQHRLTRPNWRTHAFGANWRQLTISHESVGPDLRDRNWGGKTGFVLDVRDLHENDFHDQV